MLTKLIVTASLLGMLGMHIVLIASAARKGVVSYWFWGKYDRVVHPVGFWVCIAFNLACFLFLVWILTLIAQEFL